MRICLLSYRGNMYCGGQGVYVYYLSKYLARLGHKVDLIQGPPYTWETPWCQEHKIPNYNLFATKKFFYKNIPQKKELFRLFYPGNFYEFAATRLGFFPEMLGFSFRAYQLLSRLWKEKFFDVIHDNQTLGFGMLLIQKSFPAPLLTTIHHPLSEDQVADFQQLPGFNHRLRRAVYYPLLMHQLVVPRLEKIVTVSKVAAQSVARAYRIPLERVAVVYNGVDTEIFQPNPKVPKKKRQLIFVGNTEDRKKGIRYLLEAMLYLPKDVKLLVVDGGAPRHIVMGELLRRYNLGDRVRTTGKIPTSEVARSYQESEICVVPSIYEGFGFPAAEAMACGLPVVTSDGGALPEVVGKDGETGLIVPRQEVRALAKAIMLLLNKPELAQRLAENGRRRVLELFSWESSARNMVALYQELIAEKKLRRKWFYH